MKRKDATGHHPMTLEELARRMLAMPHKDRADMVKKKPKPRKKK